MSTTSTDPSSHHVKACADPNTEIKDYYRYRIRSTWVSRPATTQTRIDQTNHDVEEDPNWTRILTSPRSPSLLRLQLRLDLLSTRDFAPPSALLRMAASRRGFGVPWPRLTASITVGPLPSLSRRRAPFRPRAGPESPSIQAATAPSPSEVLRPASSPPSEGCL